MLCIRRPHIQAEKNRIHKRRNAVAAGASVYQSAYILLAVVNGTGDLTIEKGRFRFKKNNGYWIPLEFTFELTADSPEALDCIYSSSISSSTVVQAALKSRKMRKPFLSIRKADLKL